MEQSALKDLSLSQKLHEVFHGENLEKHILDDNYLVRYAVCETGYGLDILIHDPEPVIRRQVAKQGYGLDRLIGDNDEWVRVAVAANAYGLEELMHDENRHVRTIAERIFQEETKKADLKEQIKYAENKYEQVLEPFSSYAADKRGHRKNDQKDVSF